MREAMIEQLAAMPKYEAYKDSGVEWLVEIPKQWAVKKLKYLLNEVNDRSETGQEELLSLSKYKGVVRKSSLEEKAGQASSLVGYKKVADGQLVINKMQAVNGLLAVSSLNGITSPDYSIYKEKNNAQLNIYYLNYLLSQPELLAEFKKRVTGVMEGFIRLYTDDLYDIKVIMPPYSEQTAIAAFLDRKTTQIDQALVIKEQQIALLKERKQILIQNAVTRGLNPDAPMRDSGVEWIGEIPAHWKTLFNRRLFREKSRAITDKAELPLSLSQVDGVIPSMDMKERSLSPAHRDNFKLCYPGDLIVNRFKGHQGVFFESKYRGIVTFHYGVFVSCLPMKTKYFEHLYHTDMYKAVYAGASNGMTIGLQNLSNQNFYMVKTIYPPLKEQEEIILYIETESAKIDRGISVQQQQIDKLKEYKATLINGAVTGKIRVPGLVENSAPELVDSLVA
jgi:type I restriction enzyme S subunit